MLQLETEPILEALPSNQAPAYSGTMTENKYSSACCDISNFKLVT